jgi:hypothetical protein
MAYVGSLIDFGPNKRNSRDAAKSPAPHIEIREELVLLEGTVLVLCLNWLRFSASRFVIRSIWKASYCQMCN